MSYRDERDALRARNEALAQDLRTAQAELAQLRKQPEGNPLVNDVSYATGAAAIDWRGSGRVIAVGALFALLPAGATLALALMPTTEVVVLVVALVLALGLVKVLLQRVITVVRPNQAIVLSGLRRRGSDGTLRQYRFVREGYALRIPLLESVGTLSLTLFPILAKVDNALTGSGESISVRLVGYGRIPNEEQSLAAACERFLGLDRVRISETASQTLEAVLRETVLHYTLEELHVRRRDVVQRIERSAADDFAKLGLEIVLLLPPRLTLEGDALASRGRSRIAQVLRDKEVKESEDSVAEAKRLAAQRFGRKDS